MLGQRSAIDLQAIEIKSFCCSLDEMRDRTYFLSMPLPSTVPVQAIVHPAVHQTLVDQALALPPAIDAALIGGGISIVVAILSLIMSNRSIHIANAAKDLAEQKLFTDLLKPRTEWHDALKIAVKTRRDDLSADLASIDKDTGEGKRLLKERQHEANWFFDKTITTIVRDMISEFEHQRTKIIDSEQIPNARAHIDKQEAQHHAYNVTQLMNDLSSALKPFLFVGHIKQTRKEAKGAPRISGMFKDIASR